MINERDRQQSDEPEDIESEIRRGRKFGVKDAMARMAGAGAMKGASPVSPVQQAETEIGTWLRANLADSGGALAVVLHRQITGSQLLLEKLGQPLDALADYCRSVVESDHFLKEIVRQADVEWGRAMIEQPIFERENSPPNPDDPYTVEIVRTALTGVLQRLSDGNA